MKSQLPEISYGEFGKRAPLPTDEEREQEPDEKAPPSKDLIEILGFDPSEIDWDEEEEESPKPTDKSPS